jgi:hypothetical protein
MQEELTNVTIKIRANMTNGMKDELADAPVNDRHQVTTDSRQV